MSQLTELFTDIASAIKEKDGTSDPIAASDFPERIRAIQGGVGVESIDWNHSPKTSTLRVGDNVANVLGADLRVKFDNGYYGDFTAPDFTVSPTIAELGQTEVTYSFQWGGSDIHKSMANHGYILSRMLWRNVELWE